MCSLTLHDVMSHSRNRPRKHDYNVSFTPIPDAGRLFCAFCEYCSLPCRPNIMGAAPSQPHTPLSSEVTFSRHFQSLSTAPVRLLLTRLSNGLTSGSTLKYFTSIKICE